eukprot:TRINITY_DN44491_c0_g1_i1.p1 TRINITY_DN44491_c0_g1~~TRINITY_DN44491_c0_g1_i1.p1  ORF type:complete len:437 (+),score=131.74 TRINITY_DN44491_c0_g1_i1:57-1367(+)
MSMGMGASVKRHVVDVAVVGGGAMGLSTAYWLTRENVGKKNPTMRVAIIERDISFQHSSTLLSAGGIRQQFSNRENILLSQSSLALMKGQHPDLFELDPKDVMLKEFGYLLLSTSDDKTDILNANVALQESLGASTKALLPQQLGEMFPWMNTEDIQAGSYGSSDEGWFCPGLYHQVLRRKCKEQGVLFLDDAEMTSLDSESAKAVSLGLTRLKTGETETVHFSHLVNAAGCRAASIARLAGWDNLPVEPHKRYTYNVQAPGWVNDSARGCFKGDALPEDPNSPLRPMPLLVDSNGVWIRPDGNGFICGVCPPEDPAVEFDDYDVRSDSDDMYMDTVWPTLAERVPSLEELRVASRWVGHYEYNTVDQNGIIGFHPSRSNVVYVNGFSGHGIQQSLAAGRGVSELILDGSFQTLDLTNMSPTRFDAGRLLIEKNVV